MSEASFVAQMLRIADRNALQDYLGANRDRLSPQVTAVLEERANRLRRSDAREALRIAGVMEQIAVVLYDDRARANALRLKGNLLIHLNKYQESITCYTEARGIRTRLGEKLEIARLQVGWTAALKNLALYDEALELALATRELLIEHEKWDWLANLEMNVGSIYRHVGRLDEALQIYEQSRHHFLRAEDPVGAAQILVNIARVKGEQDRFREAIGLLKQSEGVFEAHQAWQPLARASLNLAILFHRLGRYQEAWESYEQARQGFEKLDYKGEVAVVDLYHSRVYLSLNLFPEALEMAERARPIVSEKKMERHVMLADFTRAVACRGLGKHDEALRSFQNVRAFFAARQGALWAAIIDLERAALLRRMGRPTEALPILDGVAAVFSKSNSPVRHAQAQLLTAECYLDLDQANQALSLFRTVLDMLGEQQLPTLAYRAHHGLARAEERLGQRDAAFAQYQAALEEVEIIRQDLRIDEFKASFLDDKLTLYEDVVRLSLSAGEIEQAFHYVERAKSGALLDMLGRNLELRVAHDDQVDPDAWEKLRALKEEWLWHHSKLEGPPLELDDVATRAEQVDSGRVRDELSQIETRIRRLLHRAQIDRFGLQVEDQATLDVSASEYLEDDVILIEYFCIGGKILAFLLNTDRIEVCRGFACSLDEVERSLKVLNLALKQVGGLDPEYVQRMLVPLAQRYLAWFHNALLSPLAPSINKYRKLVIVPHDILHYLPFHAFHDGERYLIERFEVRYAPSAGVLAQCHQLEQEMNTIDRFRPALVMGYSDGGRLRHVADEVRSVATTLTNSLAFEEDKATLAQLRRDAGRCRLIHLASHAVFRSDNPLFSFVRLADGPLNVIDLYQLNLKTSLVTLSACETGMSQIKGGDLFGLMRGCLYAGAPSLVASLWPVNDSSTAMLMGEFYRRLNAGESMASALRAAQLALCRGEQESQGRDNQSYGHPHYWAPFFLVGADGSS